MLSRWCQMPPAWSPVPPPLWWGDLVGSSGAFWCYLHWNLKILSSLGTQILDLHNCCPLLFSCSEVLECFLKFINLSFVFFVVVLFAQDLAALRIFSWSKESDDSDWCSYILLQQNSNASEKFVASIKFDSCTGLTKNYSGLFTTKLTINLRDDLLSSLVS